MKKQRLLLSLGALVCALLLSGCMAAMIPAMILGHSSHGQRAAAHEPGDQACACACACPADDPSAATTTAPLAPPPANHDHRP